jgi:hypothetical protein
MLVIEVFTTVNCCRYCGQITFKENSAVCFLLAFHLKTKKEAFSERNTFISSILSQNLTFCVSVLQSVLSSAVDRGFEHR